MRIFLLEQVSWNDRAMSDFNLPRTIGYFRTEDLAVAKRDKDITSRKGQSDDEGWTTIDDYIITSINVQG